MTKARAVFNQVNIIAKDVSATADFYQRLGFDFCAWQTSTGVHHANAAPTGKQDAHLELDSAAFAQIWNVGWRGRRDLVGRVVVGFKVETRAAVDELYAELTGAGYRGLQLPWDAFWGARYAVVEDPDGIAVGLMSPASDEFRAAPPEV
jgi:catechol 2,3-dioxygenase-like lactoylglutathione lyase family enzyme